MFEDKNTFFGTDYDLINQGQSTTLTTQGLYNAEETKIKQYAGDAIDQLLLNTTNLNQSYDYLGNKDVTAVGTIASLGLGIGSGFIASKAAKAIFSGMTKDVVKDYTTTNIASNIAKESLEKNAIKQFVSDVSKTALIDLGMSVAQTEFEDRTIIQDGFVREAKKPELFSSEWFTEVTTNWAMNSLMSQPFVVAFNAIDYKNKVNIANKINEELTKYDGYGTTLLESDEIEGLVNSMIEYDSLKESKEPTQENTFSYRADLLDESTGKIIEDAFIVKNDEKLMDIVNNLNSKEDIFKYDNLKNNDENYNKKIEELIATIRTEEDNAKKEEAKIELFKLLKKQKDNFLKTKKIIRDKISINSKTFGSFEFKINNKEEFEKIKSNLISEIDKYDLSNEKDKESLINDIVNEVYKDEDEQKRNEIKTELIKHLPKDGNKIKKILKNIIEDDYKYANIVKVNGDISFNVLNTRINNKNIIIPVNSKHLDNPKIFTKEHTKGYVSKLKKLAFGGLKAYKDRIDELDNKDIISFIRDAEKSYQEEFENIVLNYHSSDVIDIEDGNFDKVKYKLDIPNDKKEEIRKEITEVKTFVQSNKEHFIDTSDFKQLRRTKNLTYFKELIDFINGKGKLKKHFDNVTNYVNSAIGSLFKAIGLKLEKDIVNDIHTSLLENLPNRLVELRKLYSNKDNTIDGLVELIDSLLIEKADGSFALKKEFEVNMEIALAKQLHEMFYDFKVENSVDENGNNIIKLKLNFDEINRENLFGDVFKKAIKQMGLTTKQEDAVINTIRDNIVTNGKYNELLNTIKQNILFNQPEGLGSYDGYVSIKTFKEVEKIEPTAHEITKATDESQRPIVVNKDFEKKKYIVDETNKKIDDNFLNEIVKEFKLIPYKHEFSYFNDFLKINELIDSNIPEKVKKEYLKAVNKTKFELEDYANLRALLNNKSKAIVSQSEANLIRAMSNVEIKFKTDNYTIQSIKKLEKMFNDFEIAYKNISEGKSSKEDFIKVIDVIIHNKAYEREPIHKNALKALKELKKRDNVSIKDIVEILGSEKIFRKLIEKTFEFKKDFDKLNSYFSELKNSGFNALNNLTFSGRIMQDGDLHLQSNKYAKLFLHFDDRKSLEKVKTSKYIGYFEDTIEAKQAIVGALKTALDEIDALDYEFIPDDLKSKFDISKLNGSEEPQYKIDKTTNDNLKDYMELVELILKELKEVSDNGEITYKTSNYKEDVYIPMLDYVYQTYIGSNKNTIKFYENIDYSRLVAEFDGNQNMIGVINAITGLKDDATGINGEIYKAKEDTYIVFSKILNKVLSDAPFVKEFIVSDVSRSDAKKPAQATDYGQSPKNTITDFIKDFLVKKITERVSFEDKIKYIDSFIEGNEKGKILDINTRTNISKLVNSYLNKVVKKEFLDELRTLDDFKQWFSPEYIDNLLSKVDGLTKDSNTKDIQIQKLIEVLKSNLTKDDLAEVLLFKIKSSINDMFKSIGDYEFMNKTAFLYALKEIKNQDKSNFFNKEILNNKMLEMFLDESTLNSISQTLEYQYNLGYKLNNELRKHPKVSKRLELRDNIEDMYKLGYLTTIKNLNKKAKNYEQLVERMFIELNTPEYIKEQIKTELKKKNIIKYMDIADAFYINNQTPVGSISFIEEANIPYYITPFGRKVFFFTEKATGLDKDFSGGNISYRNIAPIAKPLTYFVQSIESDVLGVAVKRQLSSNKINSIVHRFDATYGLQGFRVAKEQNKLYSAMYVDTSWYDEIINTVKNMTNDILNDFSSLNKEEIAKKVARDYYVVQNGKFDKAGEQFVNNMYPKFEEMFENLIYLDRENNKFVVKESRNTLLDRFKKMKENKIEELKENNAYNNKDKVIGQQFSNGIFYDKSSVGSLKDLIKKERTNNKILKNDSNFYIPKEVIGLTKDELRDIDVSLIENKGLLSRIESNFISEKFDFKNFKFYVDENGIITKTPIKLVIEDSIGKPKTIYSMAEDKITLKIPKKIKTTEQAYKLIHELSHIVMHLERDGIDAHKFRNEMKIFVKELINNNVDLTLNIEGKEISLKDYYETISKEDNKIDIIDIKEFESKFIEIFYGNDFIKSNKLLLALNNKEKYNDFASIRGNIYNVKLKIKDREFEITNPDEFFSILKRNNIKHTELKTFKEIGKFIYGMLNTNKEIKKRIVGLETEPKDVEFSSFVNEVSERIESMQKITMLATKKFFDGFGFKDLIGLSDDRLTIERALMLSEGIHNKLLQMTEEASELMHKMISSIDENPRKVSKSLGSYVILGLNYLNSDIVKVSKELTENKALKNVINELNEIDTEWLSNNFSSLKEESIKKLNKIKTLFYNEFGKENSEKIFKLLDKAYYGDIEATRLLTKNLHELANAFESKSITYKETLDLTRKLIALKNLTSKKLDKHYSNIKEVISLKNQGYKDKINKMIYIFNSQRNDFSIFGENPELTLFKNQKKVYATTEPTDNMVILGEVIDKNGNKVYIVAKDGYDTKIGNQEPNIIPLDLDEFEKGQLKVKYNDQLLVLNPQKFNYKENYINNDFVTMFQRNIYANAKLDYAKQEGFEVFRLYRKSGALVSREEYKEIVKQDPELEEDFMLLPENHPYSVVFGSKMYVRKKYAHFIIGTKGIDLKNTFDKAFGKQHKGLAKTLAVGIKSISDLTKQLGHTLLIVAPKFYYNSFINNVTIYAQHTKNTGLFFWKYAKETKSELNYVREAFKEIVDRQIKINELEFEIKKEPSSEKISKLNNMKKELEEFKKKIEDNDLVYAMLNGLSGSIRQDLVSLKANKDLTFFKVIDNTFGKDTGRQLRTILLTQDSSKTAIKLQTLFDETELLPKLTLYKTLIKEGYDRETALMKTRLAYPRYHNLPQLGSYIDAFIPYTKFFTAYPKMILFALAENPRKYLTMAFIFNMIPNTSYLFNDDAEKYEWMIDHNYIMFDSFGLSINSAVSFYEISSFVPYVATPASIMSWGYDIYSGDIGINDILPITVKD